MAGTRFAFVDAVVAGRNLVVTSSHEHACRVGLREAALVEVRSPIWGGW